MSRNAESRFAMNPTNIDMQRSTFNRNHSYKTSFNVGDIIPIFCDEVLPGDTYNVSTSKVVRMQSLITPMMDNMYLDTYFFFVPNRLVWTHWQEFCGENTSSPWVQQTQYQIPQLTSPVGGVGEPDGWEKGTIADYFGIPTLVGNLSVNALPFRAYALICNEWFRDENLQNPLNIPVGDSTVIGVNTDTFVTDVVKGGKPYKAAKFHDYFTSCLPYPQKGPDVLIPLGADADAKAPVFGLDNKAMQLRYLVPDALGNVIQSSTPNYLVGNYPDYRSQDDKSYASLGTTTTISSGNVTGGTVNSTSSTNYTNGTFVNIVSKDNASTYGSNVYADIGGTLGASVNQLRLAFQIQKLYEKDARGGTRYIEILKSHFGVTSPDARLQRPEYLGGNRIPININQVIQQSETSSTPQGNPAAYSMTVDSHGDFTKSFVEHGYIIGVAVARYDHTYQQGLARMWSRMDRFDFYWPVLANIGEQPVLNKEIYAQGDSVVDSVTGEIVDDQVFGYQEAWADYRYKPSYVTGEMRSNYSASLDSWHLADDYSSRPSLGDSWIVEDSSNVDRVIAVSQRLADQLFGDFYFKCKCTRPMPLYSIPGLIDHH